LCVKKRTAILSTQIRHSNWPNRWFGLSLSCSVWAGSLTCVVTSGEIISAILMGQISTGAYMKWLLNATSGNIVGGVVIVSVLNYGKVRDI
jgi:formate/nitrite transporter FocA (FNT family)